MRKQETMILLLLLFFWLATIQAPGQETTELRIDPLLLVSYAECCHLTKALGDKLFPGWEFPKAPALLYRPNVQELLVNFPHQPQGFSAYGGFNPIGDLSIYARNDVTLFAQDAQNTSTQIDEVPVLVVADQYSRMRNALRFAWVGRSQDWINHWLNDWNFLESPYSEIRLILHEAFHVFQNRMAPDKGADERVVAQYPVLDPVNNALYVLEGRILKDALLSQDRVDKLRKIKQFVAVRRFRQSLLAPNLVEYENLNEYNEGLAKYVEYRLMTAGEAIEPTRAMYFYSGFNGYSGVWRKEWQNSLDDMVKIVGVTDDRFGNRFGTGPLRFKLYELGACQAMLLDEVLPSWKEQVFKDGVYLTDLLGRALVLTPKESRRLLEEAKAEYKYDEALREKIEFAAEGKARIAEKVASILQTDKTLVKISFGAIAEKAMVARFTPFGITRVDNDSALYEMVPAVIVFKKGIMLDFKEPIPVLVDQKNKEISFAVSTPPDRIISDKSSKLDTNEFVLTADFAIKRAGRTVLIGLK